jgi:hypothetical protein
MKKFPTRRIRSWAEFERIVRTHQYRKWVYRGQCDASHELKSSLFRDLEEVEKITVAATRKKKTINREGHEKIALRRFMDKAQLFLSNIPSEEHHLEWFAIMQHYGAPTRLLDFTFSAYVAAYFALESGIRNSAVYCLKRTLFKQVDEEEYEDVDKIYENILDTEYDDVLHVWEPKYPTQRLMAQQGVFLVPSTNKVSHEKIVGYYDDAISEENFLKVIIPARLRSTGLKQLRKMNITSSNLFPGLDGFCRSFKHQSLFPLGGEKRVGTP